jgi:hypothetical protein
MLMENPGGSFILSRGRAEALYADGTTNRSPIRLHRNHTIADTPKLLTLSAMPSSQILGKDCGHVYGPIHEQLVRLPIAGEQITAEEIWGSDIDRIVRESQVVQRVLQVRTVVGLDIPDHVLPGVVRRLHGKSDLVCITLVQFLYGRTAILFEDKPKTMRRLVRRAGLDFDCPHDISIAQAFELGLALVHETSQLAKPLQRGECEHRDLRTSAASCDTTLSQRERAGATAR